MSELPLTNSVKPNSQFIMSLPVNLVDFIRPSSPQLQDPGAWVRLQLKVTLQRRTHDIYMIGTKKKGRKSRNVNKTYAALKGFSKQVEMWKTFCSKVLKKQDDVPGLP